MKRILFFFFCMFSFVSANGQRNYTEAIQQGDAAFYKQEYKTAINKYFAAEAFDPAKKDVVKVKVNEVFDAIEALRKKAEGALVETKKQTNLALKEKKVADEQSKKALRAKNQVEATLNKVNLLTRRIFDPYGFYPTHDPNYKFYFVDTNLNKIDKYGIWDFAEQFDERGFAKVTLFVGGDNNKDVKNYFMDTTGELFRVAYFVEDIEDSVKILDLTNRKIDSLPMEVLANKKLKILGLEKPRERYFPLMKVKYADGIIDYGYFDTINKKFYGYCGGVIETANKNIISNVKITRKDIPDEVKCSPVRLAAKNVFFATSTARLLKQSEVRLNDVVRMLYENPSYIVSVEGHTDNSITEGLGISNKVLTQKRALKIKNYLVGKGIAEERIFTIGYGAERPVASNKTAKGRAENRRVEIYLLSPYD